MAEPFFAALIQNFGTDAHAAPFTTAGRWSSLATVWVDLFFWNAADRGRWLPDILSPIA